MSENLEVHSRIRHERGRLLPSIKPWRDAFIPVGWIVPGRVRDIHRSPKFVDRWIIQDFSGRMRGDAEASVASLPMEERNSVYMPQIVQPATFSKGEATITITRGAALRRSPTQKIPTNRKTTESGSIGAFAR